MTFWKQTTALTVCAAIVTACASGSDISDLQPGERPSIKSDEAGLWMVQDRAEKELKNSGRVITDPALNGYVKGVLCKVVPDHCGDIRLYITDTPGFNATMSPNGMMTLFTGTLLRVENEAQLAFVMGHEAAHYLRRHSLQAWRDARDKLDGLVFFQLATAFVGLGIVGDLVALATVGSIFSYSRDNEREADRLGLEMAVKAGYQPNVYPSIWENLIKERDASDDGRPFILFATHPTSEERVFHLREQSEEISKEHENLVVGRDKFLAVQLPLRKRLLRQELRQRDYARTQVLLDRLQEQQVAPGEIQFFQGELYRLRWEEDDKQKAVEAYEKALSVGGAPPETYRSLGLVLMRIGEKERAQVEFAHYLDAAPDASDREMIKSYVKQVQ